MEDSARDPADRNPGAGASLRGIPAPAFGAARGNPRTSSGSWGESHIPSLPYLSFGRWARGALGGRVAKVVVDIGLTCPNRDGTKGSGGCVFCNNASFSPAPGVSGAARRVDPVADQIRRGIAAQGPRYRARRFLAYFQPYTNTYAPVRYLEARFLDALSVPGIAGLAIGTRPDCLGEAALDLVARLARRTFVLLEIGVQSFSDASLAWMRRGHDAACARRAVRAAAGRGIPVGIHLIFGFPGEGPAAGIAAAEETRGLPARFVKLHQLQVVRGSLLGARFARDPIPVLDAASYVSIACDFLERVPSSLVVQRLLSTSPRALLLAPCWRETPDQVLRMIRLELFARGGQGARFRARIRGASASARSSA